MPTPRKPSPKPVEEPVERTDPGGPSPEILEKARRGSPAAVKDDAPVQPGPGDATLVYDKNKGKARGGEASRLLVTAGPRKGAEFTLTETRTTIGRGSDNVVVIPDISVSRQHVILEAQGERWIVLDQGSGNGTRVNGKNVDRYPLAHGDQIAIGDTVLQFVEPGGIVVKGAAAKPPAPARPLAAEDPEATSNKAPPPSALKKRAPLYGAVLLAMVILLGAGYLRKAQRARLEREAAAQQGDESSKLAQQRFQEGVNLLKQGRWVEARDKLKIASELDSQDPEIARYLESAQAEAPHAQALTNARAALGKHDYASARTALQAVPDESALSGAAHEVQQQIRAALDQAVKDARVRAESGDAAGAAELIEPVLAAEPGRADALAVKDAVGSPKRAAAPSERPARREREERAAPEAAPAAPDVASVLEAYLAGDIGAAIERAEQAQSPRAARLLAELKQFDSSYKDGLAKQQQKRVPEALKAMEQAAAADKAIASGKEGRLGHEVKKSLSALHYQLGSAQAGSDEGLPQAAQHLRAAVQADPANAAAQSELRQVQDHAKELYMRGYVEKDNDPEAARKLFHVVLETLPSSDETATKAKRWLDKLDGKAAKEE